MAHSSQGKHLQSTVCLMVMPWGQKVNHRKHAACDKECVPTQKTCDSTGYHLSLFVASKKKTSILVSRTGPRLVSPYIQIVLHLVFKCLYLTSIVLMARAMTCNWLNDSPARAGVAAVVG